jgi:hypothetical protein
MWSVNFKRIYVSSGLFMTLAVGCTSTDPIRVEQDFGNSVRNMVQSQIYDPEAAYNPPADPPTALDGPMVGEALKSYRESVGKPSETQQDLPLNIRMGR